MSWDQDRVEKLEKLWQEGLSASIIAARLGNTTRNAVIGKLHRLGLTGPMHSCPRVARRGGRGRVARAPKLKPWAACERKSAKLFESAEPFTPGPELVIPLNERKSLLQLEDNDCRWPIGDPVEADFHFCGRHKVPGLPYCEHHCRRAFQPPEMKKRKIGPRLWVANQDITVGLSALLSGEAPINTGEKVDA